jgi:hypothetical protein
MPRRVRTILALASVATIFFALVIGCGSKPKPASIAPSPSAAWSKKNPKHRHIGPTPDNAAYWFDAVTDTVSPTMGDFIVWHVDKKLKQKGNRVIVDFWWKSPFSESLFVLYPDGDTVSDSPRVAVDASRIYPYKIAIYLKGKTRPIIVDPGIIIDDPEPFGGTGK